MLKQKTVYFREEDLPLWEAIENKAQFLHGALQLTTQAWWDGTWEKWIKNSPKFGSIKDLGSPVDIEITGLPDLLTKKPESKSQLPKGLVTRLGKGVCKIHSIPLDSHGKCLQKGCKYA